MGEHGSDNIVLVEARWQPGDHWCTCELLKRDAGVGDADAGAASLCLLRRRASCSTAGAKATMWCHQAALRRARRRHGPRAAELPRALRVSSSDLPFEYIHSADGLDENLLVLLHGLGDNHNAYADLGRRLQLPQTALLALRGPLRLPMDLGFGWFAAFEPDGTLIEPTRAGRRRVDGVVAATEVLLQLLAALCRPHDATEFPGLPGPLASGGRWSPDRVFLLGFSQGGTVALEAVRRSRCAFGGCIGLAAAMLPEMLPGGARGDTVDASSGVSSHTPVLLLHGALDAVVPPEGVIATAEVLEQVGCGVVRHAVRGKREHTVLGSAAETRVMMEFLAQHLKSRPWALESANDCAAWHEAAVAAQ